MASFFLTRGIHISQDNHFIRGSVKLPSSKDEDVRSDWCRWVTVSAQRWLAFKFSLLPHQFVVCVQDNEIVDVSGRNEILLPTGSWIDAPTSKEDDIGATDVGCMTVSGQRWTSRDSDSCPFVFFGVQNSDIVQVACLKLGSLPEASLFLSVFIEVKTSLHNHVCSDLNRCMTVSLGR